MREREREKERERQRERETERDRERQRENKMTIHDNMDMLAYFTANILAGNIIIIIWVK